MKVIDPEHGDSNVLFRTAVQKLIRFRPTVRRAVPLLLLCIVVVITDEDFSVFVL